MMANIYDQVAAITAAIEAEMKRIGYWSTEALPAEAYEFNQAFAMDTMAFSQWLQFILIPRVHQILDEQGTLPAKSMVAVQAIREFDGDDNAQPLVSLLINFDAVINNGD
jgi:uncharacterized protein YqcC (DUF446 family)